MTIHINAKAGSIAPRVLLPGDPLRAQFYAETFLHNAEKVSNIRGMYCFTGDYKGKAISIMGSGMGQASLSIYVHELFQEYNVQSIIRVGSCGSMQKNIAINDIILAQSASTNCAINRRRFPHVDFAPTADFMLLCAAHTYSQNLSTQVHVGNILSSDSFYDPEPDAWKRLAEFNVLAVEMESAELYTLASKFKRKALAILTVSDSLADDSQDILQDREKGMRNMAEIALEVI